MLVMNVAAENKCHLKNTPLFIHGLACLTSRIYDRQGHNTAERSGSVRKQQKKNPEKPEKLD